MKMLIYQQTKTNLLMAHERTEPEIIELEGRIYATSCSLLQASARYATINYQAIC